MGTFYKNEPDTLDGIRADLDALGSEAKCSTVLHSPADQVYHRDKVASAAPAPLPHRDSLAAIRWELDGLMSHVPELVAITPPASLRQACTHWHRQALERAMEHGAAVLDALGVPRLVEPDHIVVDPEAAADALAVAVAALDALDGDADLEDDEREDVGDDEPWLGWLESGAPPCGDDGDRELDRSDYEPSLGAPEKHPSTWCLPGFHRSGGPNDTQERWADGTYQDGEGESEPGYDLGCASEHDGAEPCDDKEPWLGSLEHVDQRRWGRSDSSDAELDATEGNVRSYVPCDVARANAEAARVAARQARALRQRITGSTFLRDPDEVVFLRDMPPGTALWQPHFICDRHGHRTRVEVAP